MDVAVVRTKLPNDCNVLKVLIDVVKLCDCFAPLYRRPPLADECLKRARSFYVKSLLLGSLKADYTILHIRPTSVIRQLSSVGCNIPHWRPLLS